MPWDRSLGTHSNKECIVTCALVVVARVPLCDVNLALAHTPKPRSHSHTYINHITSQQGPPVGWIVPSTRQRGHTSGTRGGKTGRNQPTEPLNHPATRAAAATTNPSNKIPTYVRSHSIPPMGSLLAMLLWGWGAFLLLCALGLWALIKLPKPVPARWEVRLFLLMGMPADQFLAFIIKVRVGDVGGCKGLGGGRRGCVRGRN